MTCIVGLVHKGRVYLGGDSAAVEDSHYLRQYSIPKIFRNGEFIMGYTSSFRMGQILQYKFTPPVIQGDLMAYMVNDFVDAVRLSMTGVMRTRDGVEEIGNFLVGVRGQLFNFDGDCGIHPITDFDVVGCGISVARGSMYSTVGQKPQKRLLTALEAASKFTTGVIAPFHIIKE
jgi:hypothetical protein